MGCCDSVVKMLCKILCLFCAYSMQISVTILQFQGTNTSTHCPTCPQTCIARARQGDGTVAGMWCGNVVRMLLEQVRMLCQLCALFCAKSYAFFCYILPLLPPKTPCHTPSQTTLNSPTWGAGDCGKHSVVILCIFL